MPGILHPGSTGVIYCSDRAMANGFSYAASHEWANLGQGAPEVGEIPNAPPRPTSIPVPTDSLEYAPTTGVKGLLKFSYRFRAVLNSTKNSERRSQIFTTTPTVRERRANIHTKTFASFLVDARDFPVLLLSSAMFIV